MVYKIVPGRTPLCKRLQVVERVGLAVHEETALRVAGATLSEGHQCMSHNPTIVHTQDLSEVAQSPQQFILRRSGSIPIVPSCFDVETAAVEAVDAARDYGGQRPRLRRVSQGGAHRQSLSPHFQVRQAVIVPDIGQGSECCLCHRHAVDYVCIIGTVTLESRSQGIDVLESGVADVDVTEQSLSITLLPRLHGFVRE